MSPQPPGGMDSPFPVAPGLPGHPVHVVAHASRLRRGEEPVEQDVLVGHVPVVGQVPVVVVAHGQRTVMAAALIGEHEPVHRPTGVLLGERRLRVVQVGDPPIPDGERLHAPLRRDPREPGACTRRRGSRPPRDGSRSSCRSCGSPASGTPGARSGSSAGAPRPRGWPGPPGPTAGRRRRTPGRPPARGSAGSGSRGHGRTPYTTITGTGAALPCSSVPRTYSVCTTRPW